MTILKTQLRFVDDAEYHRFMSVLGYLANCREPGFAVSHAHGLSTVAEMAFDKIEASSLTCDRAVQIFSNFLDEQITFLRSL